MSSFQVLPPSPGKCRCCAVEHDDMQPHDATSLYYQVLFVNAHKRSPTWSDAMAHCESNVKEAWTNYLTKRGIDVNSTNVQGDIKSKEDLKKRLDQ